MLHYALDFIRTIGLVLHAMLSLWLMLDLKIKEIKKSKKIFGFITFSIVMLANIFVYHADKSLYTKIYALLVQIPLYIVFRIFSDKKGFSLLFAVLYAIVLCVPMNYLAILLSYIFPNPNIAFVIIRTVVSLAMLYIIYKYIRPLMSYMYKYSKTPWFIYCISLTGFIITHHYITGYTFGKEHMLSQTRIILPFIVGLFCNIFITLLQFNQTRNYYMKELEFNSIKNQIETTEGYNQKIKDSLMQAAVYRHDTKHHLKIIDEYIQNGCNNSAHQYIQNLNEQISSTIINQYSKNESINIILSHYIALAKKDNIPVKTKIRVPECTNASSTDLSIILANSLDNAVKAEKNMTDKEISINIYEENDLIYMEIKNKYTDTVNFVNNLPVTHEQGHGYGTKSIAMLIDKNKGQYYFGMENDYFVFRCAI